MSAFADMTSDEREHDDFVLFKDNRFRVKHGMTREEKYGMTKKKNARNDKKKPGNA
jgi:hypothetical protein